VRQVWRIEERARWKEQTLIRASAEWLVSHRLAVHGFEALLEVIDNVLGDQLQALLSADKSLQAVPIWS
jgi:hypothetical protein